MECTPFNRISNIMHTNDLAMLAVKFATTKMLFHKVDSSEWLFIIKHQSFSYLYYEKGIIFHAEESFHRVKL